MAVNDVYNPRMDLTLPIPFAVGLAAAGGVALAAFLWLRARSAPGALALAGFCFVVAAWSTCLLLGGPCRRDRPRRDDARRRRGFPALRPALRGPVASRRPVGPWRSRSPWRPLRSALGLDASSRRLVFVYAGAGLVAVAATVGHDAGEPCDPCERVPAFDRRPAQPNRARFGVVWRRVPLAVGIGAADRRLAGGAGDAARAAGLSRRLRLCGAALRTDGRERLGAARGRGRVLALGCRRRAACCPRHGSRTASARPAIWMAAAVLAGMAAAGPLRALADRIVYPGGRLDASEIARWRAEFSEAASAEEAERIAGRLLMEKLGAGVAPATPTSRRRVRAASSRRWTR